MENSTAYCRRCGERIPETADTCPYCRSKQYIPADEYGKNKITAAILALVIGGIGAHKFYLGKPGQGILYILFCWTLIPSIISLAEAIIYFTMPKEQFRAKYG